LLGNLTPNPRSGFVVPSAGSASELLLDGRQQARPDVAGVDPEVAPGLRLVGEELGVPAVALARVAGAARGHYVPRRMVSAAHARLDMIDAERFSGALGPAVDAPVAIAREHLVASEGDVPQRRVPVFHRPASVKIPDPMRRHMMTRLTRFLEPDEAHVAPPPDLPPRLTHTALEALRMSRSRDRILANLEEMYTEAFARAKESGDASQMAALDFAYRREQLYFEILLDVRDAMEKR